jgi:hypothetical protein
MEPGYLSKVNAWRLGGLGSIPFNGVTILVYPLCLQTVCRPHSSDVPFHGEIDYSVSSSAKTENVWSFSSMAEHSKRRPYLLYSPRWDPEISFGSKSVDHLRAGLKT